MYNVGGLTAYISWYSTVQRISLQIMAKSSVIIEIREMHAAA